MIENVLNNSDTDEGLTLMMLDSKIRFISNKVENLFER